MEQLARMHDRMLGVPSESRGAERLRFSRDRSFRRLFVRGGGCHRGGWAEVPNVDLRYWQEVFEKSERYRQTAKRKKIATSLKQCRARKSRGC